MNGFGISRNEKDIFKFHFLLLISSFLFKLNLYHFFLSLNKYYMQMLHLLPLHVFSNHSCKASKIRVYIFCMSYDYILGFFQCKTRMKDKLSYSLLSKSNFLNHFFLYLTIIWPLNIQPEYDLHFHIIYKINFYIHRLYCLKNEIKGFLYNNHNSAVDTI